MLNDDEDDVSTPVKITHNYLWWIPNIVVSQSNLTVSVRNITWLKPTASQEVEMKQYNFTNNQFVLFNPGSLGTVPNKRVNNQNSGSKFKQKCVYIPKRTLYRSFLKLSMKANFIAKFCRMLHSNLIYFN